MGDSGLFEAATLCFQEMFATAPVSFALPRGAAQRSRSRALTAPVVSFTDWELHSARGEPCLSISRALSCDTSPKECISHKVVIYNGTPPPSDLRTLPKGVAMVPLSSCGMDTQEDFSSPF